MNAKHKCLRIRKKNMRKEMKRYYMLFYALNFFEPQPQPQPTHTLPLANPATNLYTCILVGIVIKHIQMK